MTAKLNAVLEAIDAANRADPVQEPDDAGVDQPEAYLYGLRMTSELDRLFGDQASDVLRIAARGQHIERWMLKRAEYPEGRAGYLQWRRDQGKAHGARLAGFMQDAGYDANSCARVGVLLRKEGIKRDAEVQQLEDVICFTFLKWYFAPFAAKHPDEKVLDIVAKTARKMSQEARVRVLSEFDLPDSLADAVKAAA
ncbi:MULTISPECIES: DUF4202 domain-containing protein [Roseobacter]|uniref:DUF4202 domain-containing protein n=1 Tax=Roseobacter litoralis (strain ATCC 49566 / DSM 6996 / JCM 21268 / NBRC 15278 / OCh 149) TaxID=391595 RepID=F7ZJS8_ROSLO|nr:MULTISPECIES: DUF4202 domain-containing protein [Roseobacter]AEI95103.1 hypothetical protein RLO149_c031470 [Roseobacter litoralis Och 149]GIT86716.1 hypothetical protein ROBYS_17320 [Roseobacter sp. OBYS 0001]